MKTLLSHLHNAVTRFLACGILVASVSCLLGQAPTSSNLKAMDFIQDYTTKGHPKAKGVEMRVGFPRDWKAEEGDRPNVVQKFVSPKGYADGYLGICVFKLPDAVSDNDIKSMFVGEGASDLLPDGAMQLTRQNTKIEQLDADLLTYIVRTERAGFKIALFSHTLAFSLNRKLVLVSMTCSSMSEAADDAELIRRGNAQSAMFKLCINRIVLPAAWQH